jgi:O-antigen biosynthesis protein
MKVSVIIVNYNVKYFLQVCLHSVFRAAQGMAVEVIVVDNNSADDSCDMVQQQFPQATLIANKDNKGFSKANNQGVAIAKGDYILFLNPDTVVPDDFFTKTVAYMDAHPDAGALGPRLIDGKGLFAPDSKKSFPTLSVAIFKTTGINKLFSRSPYFNKYYAVHIPEHEVAEVEVLSGCCMMVRSSLLPTIGGAFDEDYFMYCEDVDLSYRIQKSGYKNIYFPHTSIIHYKGESTRKATLSYVRIFNEALAKFVRKHYSKGQAQLFILFIHIGIALRAVIGIIKPVFKLLRMPLFDALMLLGTLYFIQGFWIEQVKNMQAVPLSYMLATFPVYILLWISCLYLNGAYDQPYRALRVARGMIVGTIAALAYFGLLQPGLRYSRAMLLFSGVTGTVVLLVLHEVLHRLGIFKFTSYGELPKRAVIVADEQAYEQTAATLRQVHYAPDIEGRISPVEQQGDALATLSNMKDLLYTAGIDEVIFCVNGLSYATILQHMQLCGSAYDYKIHLPHSSSFVGSNSSHTSGDLYTIDRRFNLSHFSQLRNKRSVDLFTSGLFIVTLPVSMLLVKKPLAFAAHCFQVFLGRKTWVGYAHVQIAEQHLPPIRKGVIPPYNILTEYEPAEVVKSKLNISYAQEYNPGADLGYIFRNFKFLGGF